LSHGSGATIEGLYDSKMTIDFSPLTGVVQGVIAAKKYPYGMMPKNLIFFVGFNLVRENNNDISRSKPDS
jgi:hypothetical protein